MRMWLGVYPAEMCRQHLLGEHVEMHMATSWFRKGKRLGRLAQFIDPVQLQVRHDQIATEMGRRGYRHKSPLEQPEGPFAPYLVHPEENRQELARRCPNCKLED